MHTPRTYRAIAVLAAAATVCSAAHAGGADPASRLAGPWYTPQELKALIAYADATTAQKRVLLAGRSLRTRHTQHVHARRR